MPSGGIPPGGAIRWLAGKVIGQLPELPDRPGESPCLVACPVWMTASASRQPPAKVTEPPDARNGVTTSRAVAHLPKLFRFPGHQLPDHSAIPLPGFPKRLGGRHGWAMRARPGGESMSAGPATAWAKCQVAMGSDGQCPSDGFLLPADPSSYPCRQSGRGKGREPVPSRLPLLQSFQHVKDMKKGSSRAARPAWPGGIGLPGVLKSYLIFILFSFLSFFHFIKTKRKTEEKKPTI